MTPFQIVYGYNPLELLSYIEIVDDLPLVSK